jgi:hypothetical protein
MRIYDPDFAKKLSELYRKIGGNQNDFFVLLMREGYKSVSSVVFQTSIFLWLIPSRGCKGMRRLRP